MPCWPAFCDGVGIVCLFSLALALGVGQSRSSSVRFPPLDRVPEQARGVGQLVALADGEDEQPLALVGRADFRRREEACRKAVAHADQSSGDELKIKLRGVENQLKLFTHPELGEFTLQQMYWYSAPRNGSRLLVYLPVDDAGEKAMEWLAEQAK